MEEHEKKQKRREMERKPVSRKKQEKKSKQVYEDEQYATYPHEEEDAEEIRQKNHIAQAIEHRNTSDILKDLGDPESPRTIGFYFANIICFILVMLIYYGLLIIIFIAMGI